MRKLNIDSSINNAVWILLLFIVLGGIFRFYGIIDQHSYWNDESHTALFTRGVFENGFPSSPIGTTMGIYQLALYYITALSFKLFGITEFAGRLPSVIVGTALIAVVFIVAKRLVGERGALIAAFLMAFSQVQLAWSTQLRPYIWMELFTLLVIMWVYEYLQKKHIISRGFIFACTTSVISLLFHGTGIYNFVIIGTAFLYQIVKLRKWKYLGVLLGGGALAIFIISLTPFFTMSFLLRFNTYVTHYQVYLTHHYLWLVGGAVMGFIYLYSKGRRQLAYLLAGSITFIILFSLLKVHDRYVRYSITAFPLLYILFAAGISGIIDSIKEKLSKKVPSIFVLGILIAAALAFPIYKDKILLAPQRYYSLNADMRENPIVDYKGAFEKIKRIISDRDDVIVMDAWNDRVPWYLPNQDFVFLVQKGFGKTDPVYGEVMVGTIQGFEHIKSEHSSGIVIVENWQSMTSPELQDHIRETLTFEFTQETVRGNEKDPWSISIYSWGF